MLGMPTTSGLLVAVRTGTRQLAGPIFLTAPLAWALSPLGQPLSWFPYLMPTARPTLAMSATLGAFRTLIPFAALATRPAFAVCPAMHPAFAVHPVQFQLPIFLASGLRMSLFTIFAPSRLGVFCDGGIIRTGLGRGLSPLALFTVERRGLSFGYCLVKALLALAIQVPYSGEQQWHWGHRLYRNVTCHPGLPYLV